MLQSALGLLQAFKIAEEAQIYVGFKVKPNLKTRNKVKPSLTCSINLKLQFVFYFFVGVRFSIFINQEEVF